MQGSNRFSRRRAAAVVAAATGVLALAGALSASAAQLQPIPIGPGQSTTTTAPPPEQQPESTTTTSTTEAPQIFSPPPQPQQPAQSTTTTAPPSQDQQQPLPPVEDHEADGAPPPGAGGFPPELQALMNSVHRTPANNTKKLLAALQPLEQFGLDATQRAIVGFGRFPVAGVASYSHDWWFPRFGPGWRLHQGTDIFAPRGTPVRAPVDGRTRIHNGGLGGLSVYVVQPDGTYWYMAHLQAVAPGLAEGQQVKTGQVVGFVGDSGNARGGPTHVHFEIHPRGGPAVDPKQVLDTFIADATAMAPKLIEAYAAAQAKGTPLGNVQAPQLALPEPDLSLLLPPRSALLWASSVSPAGGALQLAQEDVRSAAKGIDWTAHATVTARAAAARLEAVFDVQRWLAPLVPRDLQFVLEPAF